jgi:uncharacterized protein YbaP (TraB family)
LPLPTEFEQAYEASSALYFETDVARIQTPETQQLVLAEGMFSDGKTLSTTLTPAAWKAAKAYTEKMELPIEVIQVMKPWLFVVTIETLEIQKLGVSTVGVDLRYFRKATAAKKKTGELEPFETHLQFLTNLGAGHESEMILNAIEELDELPVVINKLLGAWRAGNMTKLDDLMLRDMRAKHPVMYEELIVKRNEAWLPKIEELLKSPAVEFVLVGAGHMAGKDGLLEKLRAKGYTVTQLNAPAGKKRK